MRILAHQGMVRARTERVWESLARTSDAQWEVHIDEHLRQVQRVLSKSAEVRLRCRGGRGGSRRALEWLCCPCAGCDPAGGGLRGTVRRGTAFDGQDGDRWVADHGGDRAEGRPSVLRGLPDRC